jgi:adenylate cyclase
MPEPLELQILVEKTVACKIRLDGPLELGRQKTGEPGPYRVLPAGDGTPARLIVAPHQFKDNISRRHLTLEPLLSGHVRVSNHSQAPLVCPERDGGPIPPAASAELATPFSLSLPSRTISVHRAGSDDHPGLYSLDERTRGPGGVGDLSINSHNLAQLQPSQMRVLLDGVPRALGVLQSAVGAADFLDRASQALVQIVRLDTGRVLLRKGDEWTTAASAGPAVPDWKPSRHVLERLTRTRSAVWQQPQRAAEPDSASLVLLGAVVAAPLLDRNEQVIGVLYGERNLDSPLTTRSDTFVEAVLVDLLACGVSTGLARMEQEQAANRATTLFEQFFSPELARHLAADPRMLEGREADVSILFADIRSFCKYSERLGAAVTFRWIGEVLSELSRCVREEEGVLVDYIGDELMAMWGAPEPQADQAARAVRAALAMQAAVAEIDQRWQSQLGEPVRVGIGINSGTAQVGNTGSQIKFKYGPLGNTVNLAARVRGLTKYLRCNVLITAATRRALGDGFIARRVVRVRVVNMQTPVDLYEVERAGSPPRQAFFAESQAALEALEAGDFTRAARLAGALLGDNTGDGPLLLTLARATDALVRGGDGFDPVWTPPGK